MNDQDNNVTNQEVEINTASDYIDALKEMKANTVSKEDYNRLKEENKKLLNAVVNGEQIEIEQQKPADIKEIKTRLLKAESTLEGVTAALELRDAIMAAGGTDPFLPAGKKVLTTDYDIETANKVAEGFRHCVDYAEGDPHIFANELTRITVDTGPVLRGKKKK